MPLISVIVPVYKVEPYLSRCVDSILTQTFTDFELILVDDGSPDNCGKICEEYAEKDKRIKVIHKENGGLSSARNAGIDWAFANSDSQWLTFIDSDDWVHPQYLELLLSGATSTNTDICVCEYTETSNFSNFENLNKVNPEKLKPEELFVNRNVTANVAWCKLYKKPCFENIRYPLGKLHEDEYTTYKILFEKNQVSYLKNQLYFYFTNPDGIIRGEWSPKRLDVLGAFEEQIAFFENTNFYNSKKLVYKNYAVACATTYHRLLQNKNWTKEAQETKGKLKEFVKKKRKLIEFDKDWEFNMVYGIVYPKPTRIIFRLEHYIKNKLKNKFKKQKNQYHYR